MTILQKLNDAIDQADWGYDERPDTIVKALDVMNDGRYDEDVDSGETIKEALDVMFNGPRFRPDGSEYTMEVQNFTGNALVVTVGGEDVEIPVTQLDYPGTDVTAESGTMVTVPTADDNSRFVINFTANGESVPAESMPGFEWVESDSEAYVSFAMPNNDFSLTVSIFFS